MEDENTMEVMIGRVIRDLRRRDHLTQKELADRIGVTEQAVSKWETDRACPDVSLMVPLARQFGVSLDQLFGVEAI